MPAAGDAFATGNGANRTKSPGSDVTRAIEYDGSFTNSPSESDDAAVASSPSCTEEPRATGVGRPAPPGAARAAAAA